MDASEGFASNSKTLRRRGAEAETTIEAPPEDPNENPDTVLLFTGLAPPALRKAKKEFVIALSHIVKLANASHKIQVAHNKLHQSHAI